jgi:hypothetical protein
MHSGIRFACALLLGVASVSPVAAETLVSPAIYENSDGGGSTPFPFAVSVFSNLPFRHQQVYAATEFTGIQEPITITELRFRIDQLNGDRNETDPDPDVQVLLSVTSKAPDMLATGSSAALDSNIGTGQALVFDGILEWDPCGAGNCPLPPFDLVIPLSPGYVYDPTAGNLLLEVYNVATEFQSQFFDAATAVDGVSTVREVIDADDMVTHLWPTDSASAGLVTQFEYFVPEAGATLSACAALLALAGARRRRA